MTVSPIPAGFRTLTPYVMVSEAGRLIAFLEAAFGAVVTFRTDHPDGTLRHGELRIGDSMMMLSEARDGLPSQPTMFYLYVPDVDTVFAHAIEAGGKLVSPVVTQVYGDRSGGLTDPSGNTWWIATHVEDVSKEEMARREAELASRAAATVNG